MYPHTRAAQGYRENLKIKMSSRRCNVPPKRMRIEKNVSAERKKE